ncbi:DNA alkylation repair protein [Lysinibacter cavernae]|uniref:3-methyladenine DNA glycosylase AlkC n=1 Tax=Lysinibacter cavernae TaxID=1640652 RepID=A0A7X5TTE5_9MICO|nr:DNA alkylation repair protein [Lysinibacter cavernae]NIH53198.1 3-methyladenine DNA glycosylase AlkC [Lysinibacter cavernae]
MPLADELISPATVELLRDAVLEQRPGTEASALSAAVEGMKGLTLRARTDLLRDAYLSDCGASFAEVQRVTTAALARDDFAGWLIWPVGEAVAAAALAELGSNPSAFEAALYLLADLTPRLTSEWAIRPLLSRDLDRALLVVREWTMHPDEHVRRFASEGTRQYLPWGTQVAGLAADPRITLPILDALYRDPSEYVRRSVANHLNDLSRKHPEVVCETATRWLADGDENTSQLVKHSLRTLVKKGDPEALALLGFAPVVGVEVTGPAVETSAVALGEALPFAITLRNVGTQPQRMVVDYTLFHQKANGTQTGKVFKLTTATLQPGQTLELRRSHSFAVISTRKYHPGQHAIEVQLNGSPVGRVDFELTVPA